MLMKVWARTKRHQNFIHNIVRILESLLAAILTNLCSGDWRESSSQHGNNSFGFTSHSWFSKSVVSVIFKSVLILKSCTSKVSLIKVNWLLIEGNTKQNHNKKIHPIISLLIYIVWTLENTFLLQESMALEPNPINLMPWVKFCPLESHEADRSSIWCTVDICSKFRFTTYLFGRSEKPYHVSSLVYTKKVKNTLPLDVEFFIDTKATSQFISDKCLNNCSSKRVTVFPGHRKKRRGRKSEILIVILPNTSE